MYSTVYHSAIRAYYNVCQASDKDQLKCMIARYKSISDWSNARRHKSADIKEQNPPPHIPYPYSDNTSDQRCRTSANAGPATFGNGFVWKKSQFLWTKKDIFPVDCMYDENLEEQLVSSKSVRSSRVFLKSEKKMLVGLVLINTFQEWLGDCYGIESFQEDKTGLMNPNWGEKD